MTGRASDVDEPQTAAARVFAFYLPQFHPIPENDEWWGKGFTEWTNVAKARPLYRGHAQPRLPADLGYYDLRLPEVRELQALLARRAGIEGFCYWHYWFGSGRRILERPFTEVLESGHPEYPFCLAWANESWTGVWHGDPGKILVSQEYPGVEDEKAHFAAVLPAFRDPRYVRIYGKPLFAIYAAHCHPDPTRFVRHWRELAAAAGLPGLYFVAIYDSKATASRPFPHGDFDAVTELGPGDFLQKLPQHGLLVTLRKIRNGNFGRKINAIVGSRFHKPDRHRYANAVRAAFTGELAKDVRYLPTVLSNWDNTPRSGRRGVVLEGSTPHLFRKYLDKAIALVRSKPYEERIVFLKAWNEWAEGNYVEPDARFGHQYLDALRLALFEKAHEA
jgi:lipopolysaccharide biosynthesis protein